MLYIIVGILLFGVLVAVHELIPECQRNQSDQPYFATMGIVTGFAVMMLLDVMLG